MSGRMCRSRCESPAGSGLRLRVRRQGANSMQTIRTGPPAGPSAGKVRPPVRPQVGHQAPSPSVMQSITCPQHVGQPSRACRSRSARDTSAARPQPGQRRNRRSPAGAGVGVADMADGAFPGRGPTLGERSWSHPTPSGRRRPSFSSTRGQAAARPPEPRDLGAEVGAEVLGQGERHPGGGEGDGHLPLDGPAAVEKFGDGVWGKRIGGHATPSNRVAR